MVYNLIHIVSNEFANTIDRSQKGLIAVERISSKKSLLMYFSTDAAYRVLSDEERSFFDEDEVRRKNKSLQIFTEECSTFHVGHHLIIDGVSIPLIKCHPWK